MTGAAIRHPFVAICVASATVWGLLPDDTRADDEHPLSIEDREELRTSLERRLGVLDEQVRRAPQEVEHYSARGDVRLFLGRFDDALADYNRMVELKPETDASHWRRGIAFFYAGQYDQAARQFQRYHSYDNVDRENGIWRYLSQVKADGEQKAKQGLLKYEKDDREPFPDVYRMFAGTLTPEEVLRRIESAKLGETERQKRLFYAHLYIGLLHAVHARADETRAHLRAAVANEWPRTAGYGPRYMWHVGRVHYELLIDPKRTSAPGAASFPNTEGVGDTEDPARGLEPILAPPPALNLDPFYTKCILIDGFPVVSSARTRDAAVREAAYIVRGMLRHRPVVIQALAESGTRLAVMAHDEMTTDIPEHGDLTPKDYWDRRARGLGATDIRPAVSCGEENLLQFPGDPYSTENILVHEFAHAIHQMGLSRIDKKFDARLRRVFRQAKEDGLWKDTYAMSNHHEYWAEGVQSYFDTNRENDREHNHVNTREELQEHDPRLFELIDDVFRQNQWRYAWPSDRTMDGRQHLTGFDRSQAPKFRWPERLKNIDLSPRPPERNR